jgi:hypothetical protein
MHEYIHEYPDAPVYRIREAIKLFPYKSISAEKYAVTEGHSWSCFSFGEYIYPDKELNEWIHTLDDIFHTRGRLKELRLKYLTTDEIEEIEKYEECQPNKMVKIETVCYALHEYFGTKPRQISVCPQCKTSLIQDSTTPTRNGQSFRDLYLITAVETTKSHCPACQWWALREFCMEFEGRGFATDELITLLPESDKHSEPFEMEADMSQPPWDNLYRFREHLKENAITADIVEWLWGAPLK